MAADPKVSQGARLERAAFLKHLRARRKALGPDIDVTVEEGTAAAVLDEEIAWVEKRRKRYDKDPGGLGTK